MDVEGPDDFYKIREFLQCVNSVLVSSLLVSF